MMHLCLLKSLFLRISRSRIPIVYGPLLSKRLQDFLLNTTQHLEFFLKSYLINPSLLYSPPSKFFLSNKPPVDYYRKYGRYTAENQPLNVTFLKVLYHCVVDRSQLEQVIICAIGNSLGLNPFHSTMKTLRNCSRQLNRQVG